MRRILAVTGSRADYGLMRPVFAAIARHPDLALELLVTGMHLAPRFRASLDEIERDDFAPRHLVDARAADGSGQAMAEALGAGLTETARTIARLRPDLLLLQGDRGEMLAAAAAAAHLNVPVVHMSGGDRTGTIDDSIRNAITAFAHVHLTTCGESSARVIAMGEAPARVLQVGEPALDGILGLDPLPLAQLAAELDLDPGRAIALATQHPVTDQPEAAAEQITETLEALAALDLQTVFTYPNTDAGGEAMTRVLEAWRGRAFLRVVPHLGSRRYLSLMRYAAVLVGNSSSGIIEAPSFRLPAVNVGTRQHRRTRAVNVIDVGHDRQAIRAAIERALHDQAFRAGLAACVNPYGDGTCAERTVDLLARLRITPVLCAKWLDRGEPVVAP